MYLRSPEEIWRSCRDTQLRCLSTGQLLVVTSTNLVIMEKWGEKMFRLQFATSHEGETANVEEGDLIKDQN